MIQLTHQTGNICKLTFLLGLTTVWGCGNSSPDAPLNATPTVANEPSVPPLVGDSATATLVTNDSDQAQIENKPTVESTAASQSLAQSEPPKPAAFDENVLQAFQKLTTPIESFEDWEVANQALLNLGESAIPLLAQRLTQGDHVERELAASTLASMGQVAEGAAPALEKSLSDELPFVRANAAVALVQFPEKRQLAVPILVEFLEHSDKNLQTIAAMNLISLGKEASPHVAELKHLLEQKTTEPQVLLPVVQLLGRIGPKAESALPQLKQIAFEQEGEVGAAANSAIQLIQTTDSASPFPEN